MTLKAVTNRPSLFYFSSSYPTLFLDTFPSCPMIFS